MSSSRSFWLFSAAWERGSCPTPPPRKELSTAWWKSFACMLHLEGALGAKRQRRTNELVDEPSNTEGQMCLKRWRQKSLIRIRAGRGALAFLISLVASIPIYGQVRVWEGVLDLPAYEEGSPDSNPPFDQFATGRFNYPYTLRNEITNTPAEHQWRAVYLENEYLKCSVLPDMGGHLYTCVDKISGQPMFYANPSIRKARIGYRGAWAAFGVEFNFPVSHNWVSMSPV